MSLKPQIMTGLPAGTKATGGGRVDFKVDRFDNFIAVKGLRYFWSRATLCPCKANDQTEQVDPSCALCGGYGWLSFLPDRSIDAEADAHGNPVELNDAKTGVSIRAVISGITKDPQDYERFGRWIFGSAKCTVQSHNRIGHRDRLVSRDATLSFSQLVEADGGAEIGVTGIKGRHGLYTPIAHVNMMRSVSREFTEGEDFSVSDAGTIAWSGDPPASGVQLTIHAEFFPVWVVMDHPYAARDTYVQHKAGGDAFRHMPLHATVKLDFLAND